MKKKKKNKNHIHPLAGAREERDSPVVASAFVFSPPSSESITSLVNIPFEPREQRLASLLLYSPSHLRVAFFGGSYMSKILHSNPVSLRRLNPLFPIPAVPSQ